MLSLKFATIIIAKGDIMKKKLSDYSDISGISKYDFWSYCADNDMWYEDEKEILPIPLAKSEIVKDLTCEIKIDHYLYREQNWEEASPENELEEYVQYLTGKENGADSFSSVILLRTPKQDLHICISPEGMWFLNCFLTQLETQNFSAEYIEQWFDLKFIAWTDKNNNARLVVHSYMDGYKFLQTIFDITINRDILISKLKNIIDIWKRKVYTTIKKIAKPSNLRYDYALDKFFPQLKLLSYLMLHSIEKGDLIAVKQLLKEDIDINFTIQGETPLCKACETPHLEIVKTLIKAGADVNLPADRGVTPLMVACLYKQKDIIVELLNNGADIKKISEFGGAMSHAVGNHSIPEIIKLLIKAGADLNERNSIEFDETPLMCACRLGKVDIAKILIDAGADINIKNSLDYTALDIAKEEKNEELIKLLKNSK